MKRSLTVLACALSLGGALAATRVPGTYTFYSPQRDPITDANTGSVLIYEANDTSGQTAFTLRCADRDRPELWASLISKNTLLPADDAALGLKPAVTIRLGEDPPAVLRDSDLVSVVGTRDDVLTGRIGFQGAVVRQIAAGMNAGKRLVVRVNRLSGGQALTYTFPAQGFAAAWKGVNGCQSFGAASGSTGASSQAGSARPSAPAGSGTPTPRFTRWYFTTCRDAASGAVRAGLVAGRAHLCDLVIETLAGGAAPVAAEFRYELEYREGGVTGKLTLPGVDRWPSNGGTVTHFRQEGSRLIFTLPLNVRARAERVYTSLNVTGRLTFANGAVKSVYEPLPVRP